MTAERQETVNLLRLPNYFGYC